MVPFRTLKLRPSGSRMRTWGTLDLGSGRIAGQTFIQTITWFGGYHGAATVIFADANDAPVHQTQNRRYGVDGTAIGASQRTTAWWEQISPEDASRVTKIYADGSRGATVCSPAFRAPAGCVF